ncbi:putative E3 ubiquitin-protein ligase mug30 [Golovinomyces cichoracearum]|uniref:HECT-type E3 ubiquitin transferase n=1 Tax=Golovinomyces cichoracearum TaxID=62708 RepID=A0A420JB39_9PEZI|nr:putative E3 ubiquitin-protein ligase mug30 [Golovinomyces cichoracearum]
MPQWSSRLLSPSSRNDLGVSGAVHEKSPFPARSRSKYLEPELLENTNGIPDLAHSKVSSSNTTKISTKSNHSRSMSHPFPSIFSGKKKRQVNALSPGNIKYTTDDSLSSNANRDSVKSKAEKMKHPDRDLLTGKCMTCNSLVRWPKELNVFRCTVCLTINDLKPVVSETQREDICRISVMSELDVPTDFRSENQVPSLSLEKTKNIVNNCVTTYLLNRLKHATDSGPSQSRIPYSTGKKPDTENELLDGLCSTNDSIPPLPISDSIYSLRNNEHEHEQENQTSYDKVPLNSCHDYSSQFSSSTPVNFCPNQTCCSKEEIDRNTDFFQPKNSADNSSTIAQQKKTYDAKSIFKPLEDYIVGAFGSFECINSSFCTVRPNFVPRAVSEGSNSVSNSPHPREIENIAETQISDLDAKTLLLGDFAENGSWWTGNRSNMKSLGGLRPRHGTTDGAQECKNLVTLKSPRVNWIETNQWYNTIIHAGKSWRRSLDMLAQTKKNLSQLCNLTDHESDEIEDSFLEARIQIQQILLRATDNLLKRPSRPLNDPSDLRFLLIILANPLLYPLSSNSRGKQRSRSSSWSPNQNSARVNRKLDVSKQNPSIETSYRVKGSSGKHSGIIKRILGLLSNVSNECHHHLVSWFARYPESQFRRTTDLIGSFVTYRLLRQHGKKRDIDQDPTAGLIPEMSELGRVSPAALHATLGVVGKTSKKVDCQPRSVIYNDDWQIRAAARVMSLLFSANNSGLSRRNEGRPLLGANSDSKSRSLPRARAYNRGQIIATSDFYNSLLDCSDLIADFEAWESRRCKFSFCQYPFFLSIWAKIQIMEHDARRQMEVKAREAFFDSIMTRKMINQYLVLTVRRDCLVEDSLKAVSEVVGTGSEEIKKGLRITFKGEEGIDAGGLRKEWFLLLVRDVFNPDHGMFTYDEDSRCCYFNPNSFETTDQFFLVGVVLGLAIHNSTILDVALPSFAFRKLLAAAPPSTPGANSHTKPLMTYSLEDLAQYRPALANGLRQLLDYEGDVESTFCRDFVADIDRYGQMIQVPLCLNGERRTVTNENRKEFVDLYVRYLLDTAVSRQFEPFKRGFFTVCGGNALSLFRPEEIELLIRGSDEHLDILSLRAVCIYDNWGQNNEAESEPVVQWFWETFQSAKPQDQRKLLGFITGSDRIPAMGAANLVIKLSCLGDDGNRFPIARTCFNQISLWKYTSKEKLENMLWRAVHESEGFGLK